MLQEFKIKSKLIGNKKPVFIIAEVGINHNGSYQIAKKLVDVAKQAGADCVKFQTHITEKEMIKTNITPGKISKKTLWRSKNILVARKVHIYATIVEVILTV